MSRNRVKYQTLKNVLPKYIKEELVKSIRQQIDTISCIYYFFYIAKANRYTEYFYGHDVSESKPSVNEIIELAMKDLKLKSDLNGAFEKIKSMNKLMKKPSTSFILSNASSLYSIISIVENSLFSGDLKEYGSLAITLSYIYKGSITSKRLKDLGRIKEIDTNLDLYPQIERLHRQYKIISKMISTAKNRVELDNVSVFYRGKVYNKSNSGRISKNLKSALHSIESFKSNLSEYLYLYDDIMDVPIIIDGLIQATTEMGYAQEEQSISVISVQKNNIKVDRRKLKMNHVSLSEDFVKRASARNIYHTMAHELTHSWQYHAERVHPKKYKSLMNSWTRYFNELSRLGQMGQIGDPYRTNISRQQKEDFIEGLSDFIKVKKLKNGYRVDFLQSKLDNMFFPTKDSMCLEMVRLLTPTRYSMQNPVEFMAEVISMLALGQYSPIGIKLDSDISTFYNPMSRFLKLAERNGFNRY